MNSISFQQVRVLNLWVNLLTEIPTPSFKFDVNIFFRKVPTQKQLHPNIFFMMIEPQKIIMPVFIPGENFYEGVCWFYRKYRPGIIAMLEKLLALQ